MESEWSRVSVPKSSATSARSRVPSGRSKTEWNQLRASPGLTLASACWGKAGGVGDARGCAKPGRGWWRAEGSQQRATSQGQTHSTVTARRARHDGEPCHVTLLSTSDGPEAICHSTKSICLVHRLSSEMATIRLRGSTRQTIAPRQQQT